MQIAVVGTGYVGLVTGACFAETGNHVICVDIDANKVDRLKKGEVPIYEPGLDIIFERNTKQGRLLFTTNLKEAIKDAAIIFLALPTPPGADGSADLSYILKVAKDLSEIIGLPNTEAFEDAGMQVGTGAELEATGFEDVDISSLDGDE